MPEVLSFARGHNASAYGADPLFLDFRPNSPIALMERVGGEGLRSKLTIGT